MAGQRLEPSLTLMASNSVFDCYRPKALAREKTRDRLCPLDLLESVRQEMKAVSKPHIVEGGDHSLLVTRTQFKVCGETQDDVDDRISGGHSEFSRKVIVRDAVRRW
jgi:hypothetical protein